VKLIKMFGLTAVAAVVAMAFVGASSAMATNTVLCTVNEDPCLEKNWAKSIHMVTTAKPKLLSSIGTIECASSLGEGTLGKLGLPQVATLTALTWAAPCALGKTACTVTTESLGTMNILKTGANVGTADPEGTTIHVECGALINCKYTGKPGATLSVTGAGGGSNGILEANKLKVEKLGSGFCPSTAEWDAKYEPLTAVYVSS